MRELRNAMQNATVTVRGPVIDRARLAAGRAPPARGPPDTLDTLLALPWTEAVARLEKALLARALRGRRRATAPKPPAAWTSTANFFTPSSRNTALDRGMKIARSP